MQHGGSHTQIGTRAVRAPKSRIFVFTFGEKIATVAPKLQRFLQILTQNSEVFKSEHPWRSVLYLRGNSSLIPLRLTAVCSPKVQLD